MRKGKSKFSSKQTNLDILEKANTLKEFGVNDNEKKAKLEIDLILGVSIIHMEQGKDVNLKSPDLAEIPVPQIPIQTKAKADTINHTDQVEIAPVELEQKPKKRGIFAKLFSLFTRKKN